MSLAFDPERSVSELYCADCHGQYRLVHGQLTWYGEPHAVYFAGCHEHKGVRDVRIDVILGWARDFDTDKATFGCRVGPMPGQDGPVASLVQAAADYGDDPEWGRRLGRDEALSDHRITQFWDAVDYVLIHDPTIRAHVYDID